VFGIHWRRATTLLLGGLIVAGLALGVVSCGGSSQPAGSAKTSVQSSGNASLVRTANISEVSPPAAIAELREVLEQYQPQVEILSPKSEAVLEDNSVAVQFQVADLPLFKDPKLGLGPHLHVLLDNQTYQAVYDVSQPVVFSDLTPGTHTIRAFASRPWHESFKNEGAYAQVTFHVLTKTKENNPDLRQPLLTYSRPQGTYGAEPIMLDFYLANAPLHLIAEADEKVDDWRIRCTINGTSFIVDRWQPFYLQGFKPGKNWVQLEFLDQQGKSVTNAFNTTTRIVNYEPGGKDTLSKLVRGELKASDVRSIVSAGALLKQAAPPPKPSPSPAAKASPTPEAAPAPKQTKELPAVPVVPLPLSPAPAIAPVAPKPIAPIVPSPGKEKSGGFLDRFRKEAKKSPTPEPTIPADKAIKTAPQPEKLLAPEASDLPQPSPAPKLAPRPELAAPPKITPKKIEPTVKATPLPEVTPKLAPKATKYEAKPTPKPSPSAAITPKPAVVETPKPQPSPKAEASTRIKTAPVTIETVKPAVVPTSEPSPSKPKGFLDRFRKPESSPTPTPQVKVTPALPAPKISPSPQITPKLVPPVTKFEDKPTPKPSPAAVITPKPLETLKPQPTPKAETSAPIKTAPATIEPVKPAISPPTKPEPSAQPDKLKGFLDRFRKPEPSPSPTPRSKIAPALTQPTIEASPSPQITPKLAPPVTKFEAKPAPKFLPKTSEPNQPEIPANKSARFLDRFRQRSQDQNQTQLKDYLNRNRPDQQTSPTVPSVLPAVEAPAKPTVVKLPITPVKPSPAVKVPAIPKRTIAPDAPKTPVGLGKKEFPLPSQTVDNLKIIRPEESPALPSRYLKKPDPEKSESLVPAKTAGTP
jgi:hypothetical protein